MAPLHAEARPPFYHRTLPRQTDRQLGPVGYRNTCPDRHIARMRFARQAAGRTRFLVDRCGARRVPSQPVLVVAGPVRVRSVVDRALRVPVPCACMWTSLAAAAGNG